MGLRIFEYRDRDIYGCVVWVLVVAVAGRTPNDDWAYEVSHQSGAVRRRERSVACRPSASDGCFSRTRP